VFASTRRYALAVAFLIALFSPAPAQDKKDAPKEVPRPKRDPDDYRLYFKTPVTVADYWNALQFEIEVGSFPLAAKHLRGLVEKAAANEEDLMQIEQEKGMSAFLRLQNIPKWSDDPKVQAQAKQDVRDLIARVSAGLKAKREDPRRIQKYIQNLSASPEERAYALKELYLARAAAVPELIRALREADGEERFAILSALPKLHEDTLPSLLAALDINDTPLRLELLDVLRQRAAAEAVPFLWHLAGSPQMPDTVRKKATDTLAYLLDVPAGRLQSPKAALTREAERYYQHQVRFPDPDDVTIWHWDDRQLIKSVKNSARHAEEFYGLRFAQQALDIDPAYEPAQVVFLSLALERAVEQAGLDQSLTKTSPKVKELLATVNPDLVTAVLERALADQRTPVILGAVRALGDLGEVRAARPTGRGEPPLVRALNYPDRRVKMAAVEALLRLPGAPSGAASTKIVEVLRREVAGESQAGSARGKVLVANANADLGSAVGQAVADAGYEPVYAASGRDALRRLNQAADIDVILIDSNLTDPSLSFLLAQLRADLHYGRLPLFLTALPTREEAVRLRELFRDEVRSLADRILTERHTLEEAIRGLSARYDAERNRLEELFKRLPEEADQERRRLFLVLAELPDRVEREKRRLEEKLKTLPERYQVEVRQLENTLTERYSKASRRREEALLRLVERYPNVWVVPAGLVLDADWLKRMVPQRLAEADMPPLAGAERKSYAERSLTWLAKMARGEVPGYDIRPAADAILGVLQSGDVSDEALAAALQAAGRLPGARPQTELAGVVLDARRSAALRSEAAGELVRHIQQHGTALSAAQTDALAKLWQTADADANLKASVALVLGSLRPDARQTGERLKGYTPPLPAATTKPPPAPDKGKEKEKDPDKEKDK
jgi:hypothetical protein